MATSKEAQREFEIRYRRQLFEQKFTKRGPAECWPWNAAKLKQGHGIFAMGELCGAAKPAYIAAWLFYKDNFFDLDAPVRFTHLCGNFGCVNPNHLIIIGAGGVENDSTVLEFIASRHPSIRSVVSAAAKLLNQK